MTALTLSPERPVADARIDGPRDSFDSLDLLTTLARFKKLIACFLALSLSMGLALALLLPKTYTAGAKLLPPMEPESMAMSLMG